MVVVRLPTLERWILPRHLMVVEQSQPRQHRLTKSRSKSVCEGVALKSNMHSVTITFYKMRWWGARLSAQVFLDLGDFI